MILIKRPGANRDVLKKRTGAFAAMVCCMMLFPEVGFCDDGVYPGDVRYAIIVANNQSLDEGVLPLRFADDDGARYYEMFKAAGADVTLLAVLDADAQRRYPDITAVSIAPKKKALLKTLQNVFARIEVDVAAGKQVHFYFVYAGHGNVGPNQEGYLNLLDARFGRSELYREIVAKSPATFNHLILDACQAYFMVNKRGGRPDKRGQYKNEVRSYLDRETLGKYPNTGVILAASSESETHEWQRLEAGIFSHEVRSALMGAGDVNNDGVISYAETAGFVSAANAAVDVPSARLNVYYHAPASRISVPLMAIDAFVATPMLKMPEAFAGRYHVEDARGVRVMDLNYSTEQPVTLLLVGDAPFYVRSDTEEVMIESDEKTVDMASLQLTPITESHRGSVEASFRKHLFEQPYGMGFYRGLSIRDDTLSDTTYVPEHADPKDGAVVGRPLSRVVGWTALGTGLAVGLSSVIVYGMARVDKEKYDEADNITDAQKYRESSSDLLDASRILLGVGVGMALIGSGFLVGSRHKKRSALKKRALKTVVPFGDVGDGFAAIGVIGEF